jgi:hypothetical protein
MYDGGVLSLFWYGLYTGTYPARCGYAIKNVKSWMIENTPPEELRRLVDEACADPRLRAYPYLYHLLKYPEKNPILFDLMLNPLDGPSTGALLREKLDRVQVPPMWAARASAFRPAADLCLEQAEGAQEAAPFTRNGLPSLEGRPRRTAALVRLLVKGLETGIMDERTCATLRTALKNGIPPVNSPVKTRST